MPVMTFAASFASGTPIALATNGTVREARGIDLEHVELVVLDRELHVHQPDDAQLARQGMRRLAHRVEHGFDRVCGGITIAASPECTPANSMCSSMPIR
jgi:hypothetical protein